MNAIEDLPEPLRTIVEEYFFAERKMTAIASDLCLHEAQVARLRTTALLILQRVLNNEIRPEPSTLPVAAEKRAVASGVAVVRRASADRSHTSPASPAQRPSVRSQHDGEAS